MSCLLAKVEGAAIVWSIDTAWNPEERYKPFTCGSSQPRQLKIPHRVSTSPMSKRCCNGSVSMHFFFGKLTLFSAILRPCAMWHVNVKLQQKNFAPIEEWKSTLWDADKLVICKLRLQHGTSQVHAWLYLEGQVLWTSWDSAGKIFQGMLGEWRGDRMVMHPLEGH